MKCFLFCRFCLNLLITTYIASSCFLFICFLHSPFSVLQGHPGANFFSVNVFVFHIIFPLLSCFVLFIQVFTCFFCLCRWPSGLLFFSNRGPWRQYWSRLQQSCIGEVPSKCSASPCFSEQKSAAKRLETIQTRASGTEISKLILEKTQQQLPTFDIALLLRLERQ